MLCIHVRVAKGVTARGFIEASLEPSFSHGPLKNPFADPPSETDESESKNPFPSEVTLKNPFLPSEPELKDPFLPGDPSLKNPFTGPTHRPLELEDPFAPPAPTIKNPFDRPASELTIDELPEVILKNPFAS